MSVRAILKNAGELLIGEVVNECDELIEFVDLSFVVLGKAEGNQMGIQFVPADIISMNPPLSLKAVIKNPEEKPVLTIYKNQILIDNVQLKDDLMEGFERARNPKAIITPSKSIITPEKTENKVIKLFE